MELTQLQERAAPLVGRSHIGDVRLFGLNVQHERFTAPGNDVRLGDLSLDLSSNYSGYTDGEPSSASFMVTVKVEALEEVADGESEVAAKCEVTYGALYTFDSDMGAIEPDNLQAFGYTIATLAVWPFVRATLANALREMNHLGMVLPTLSQRDVAEAISAEPA